MNDFHPSRRFDSDILFEMSNFPPLTTLQAFDLAARHLSFKTTAEVLAITPSAVSHKIRQLEEHFGVSFFIRRHQGLSLTREGESYARSVRMALDELDRAGARLQHRKRGGPLRISALPLFSSIVLLPGLAEFTKSNAGMAVRIETTSDYANFSTEDVDVAVRMGHGRWPGLRAEKLFSVATLPVSAVRTRSPGSPRAMGLQDATLIHATQRPDAWPHWFARNGKEMREGGPEIWVDSPLAALEAAANGAGVALGVHPLVWGFPGMGVSIEPVVRVAAGSSEGYYIVHRKEDSKLPHLRAFKTWMQQRAAVVIRRSEDSDITIL